MQIVKMLKFALAPKTECVQNLVSKTELSVYVLNMSELHNYLSRSLAQLLKLNCNDTVNCQSCKLCAVDCCSVIIHS